MHLCAVITSVLPVRLLSRVALNVQAGVGSYSGYWSSFYLEVSFVVADG